MFDSFPRFACLPVELQVQIWVHAVRPDYPGVQVFSLARGHASQSSKIDTSEAPWPSTYVLTAPKWAFGPKPGRTNVFDKGTASWTKNNPSTYTIDSGLWTTCQQSYQVMRDVLKPAGPMLVPTTISRGSCDTETDTSKVVSFGEHGIVISPSRDLFILQLDDPAMLSWALFDDGIPDHAVPSLLRLRHVGWQYHTVWASSLDDSRWIASLDSLCCYIVYGARFGGLETLWLINHRIKRKHWVPSKEEVDKPEARIFEADGFRLVEVLVDDSPYLRGSSEQLPWDEVIDEGSTYNLDDFLAFVNELRQLVAHALFPTPVLGSPARSVTISVLACEG